MVALWILIIAEALIIGWLGVDKARHSGGRALTSTHELVRVYWKNSEFSLNRGWAWKCSCGGGALINSYNNPTEARALNAWKAHKGLYTQLEVESGDSKYKVLYEDKQAEFEKFKSACYCKDLH